MAFLPWETSGSPLKRERERASISTQKVSGSPWFSAPLHCHNPANCIQITSASTDEKRKSSPTAYVPSLFVSNVMSLAPKVDELRHLVKYANLDLVCITGSWFKSHMMTMWLRWRAFFLLLDLIGQVEFFFFWQLLADVDLLYFHRGQPQHRELHALLFSNSVWVL